MGNLFKQTKGTFKMAVKLCYAHSQALWNFYCCRSNFSYIAEEPLEVLRISTVVDPDVHTLTPGPLEVLRISTVVDG